MNSKKFHLFLFLFIFICISLIYSIDVIKIGVNGKFSTLNPLFFENPEVHIILPVMYNGLIRYNPQTGDFTNILAEEIKWSEDYQNLEIRLKDNLTFHDGKKLSARDVKYTIRKYKEANKDIPRFKYIDNLKVVDVPSDKIIRITLEKPNASTLFYLAHLQIAQYRDDDKLSEVGTGPFIFTDRKNGILHFRKNKNYFMKKASVDELQIISYSNFSQQWGALIKGEIDFSYLVLPKDFRQLKENPEFNAIPYLSPMYYLIGFNFKNDLFKDRDVRKAFNLAVDRNAIIIKCLDGMGEICNSPIFPENWAVKKDIQGFGYDPGMALQILNRKGWKDSDGDGVLDKGSNRLSFSLLVDKGDTLKKSVVQALSLYLAEVGIEILPRFIDRKILIRKHLMTGEFESVFVQLNSYDPDGCYDFWHSSQINGGRNCFSYKNPEVDKSLEKGRASFDLEARKMAYADFQEAFIDDPPGILLFYPYKFLVANKRIKGIKISSIEVLNTINEWSIVP
jgi:peptide/nickel transport system substrate-binding protein